MSYKIIDYDQINVWGPWLTEVISEIAPIDLKETIKQANPEYIEDAAEIVFGKIGQNSLVGLLLTRLKEYRVKVYHGTRLSNHEIELLSKVEMKCFKITQEGQPIHPLYQKSNAILVAYKQ